MDIISIIAIADMQVHDEEPPVDRGVRNLEFQTLAIFIRNLWR